MLFTRSDIYYAAYRAPYTAEFTVSTIFPASGSDGVSGPFGDDPGGEIVGFGGDAIGKFYDFIGCLFSGYLLC